MDLPKRNLVKTESKIEQKLYEALVNFELYPELQKQIGKYRVDMAFPKFMLVIECDGKDYHLSNNYQIEYDKDREDYLINNGWKVIRFMGKEIYDSAENCAKKIMWFIQIGGEIRQEKPIKKFKELHEINYETEGLDIIEWKKEENRLIREQMEEENNNRDRFIRAGVLFEVERYKI